MYDLLQAKLLILPQWVVDTLEAHERKPRDITTRDGLNSILSEDDVRFYLKQCEQVLSSLPSDNPVKIVLDSLQLLHINNTGAHARSTASRLEEYVKINTSYGKDYTHYDFFKGCKMNTFLPRLLAASLPESVKVDPYVEHAGGDLFVLRFTTGLYPEQIIDLRSHGGYPIQAASFVKNTLDSLMGQYGFDAVKGTKLFELYTLIPGI